VNRQGKNVVENGRICCSVVEDQLFVDGGEVKLFSARLLVRATTARLERWNPCEESRTAQLNDP
jgi:hypothetical protein